MARDTVIPQSARDAAEAAIAGVRDSPEGRLDLLRSLYEFPGGFGRGHLPYRRAASAFMGWQLRRGVLDPPTARLPGSPWWRAVNEAIIRDTYEARELALGRAGKPEEPTVAAWMQFVAAPTAHHWYRAHNLTVASAYLRHQELAVEEARVERFFLNLVLVRVLYAHALVAAPRLALAWLAPAGRPLGDPRLGMTAMFLSLSRVLPARYPLGDDLERVIAEEHGFGHLLDVGVVKPRFPALYEWSAGELGLPDLRGLISGDVPAYAWDPADAQVWSPPPSRLARAALRLIPADPGPAVRPV